MGREANGRAGLRLMPACAAVALVLGSSVVMADEGSAASDGLLHFANVRVVNAPSTVETTGATQAGLRLYKDTGSGELRAPTAEEMQAVAAERPAPRTNMRKSYARNGATRVVLDDSFLEYSVIVRQPDGSLAEVCVTGADKAAAVGAAASQATESLEARNVR